MEPVFMILGESAALAAEQCNRTKVRGAGSDYAKLRDVLADAGR